MEHTDITPADSYPERAITQFRARLGEFRSDLSGAVAAEFVVILPALIAVFVLITNACVLLATSSEVQAVSFELTRGSLRYYEPGIDSATLCASLREDLAPTVIKTGDFLSESRFLSIECSLDAFDALTVTVVYDMTNHPMNGLGRLIGLDIAQFTRSSKMWL
jgi:Flp pilus assembly pilin Flp